MAKCKNCKNIKWLSDISEDGERGYNWCPIIDDCPDPEAERNCGYYDEMTNADRIRSMTDEELAKHFSNLIKDTQEHEYCEEVSDWLKWLQSQVEV